MVLPAAPTKTAAEDDAIPASEEATAAAPTSLYVQTMQKQVEVGQQRLERATFEGAVLQRVWPLAFQLARVAEAHARAIPRSASAVRLATRKCYKVMQRLGVAPGAALADAAAFKAMEAAFALVLPTDLAVLEQHVDRLRVDASERRVNGHGHHHLDRDSEEQWRHHQRRQQRELTRSRSRSPPPPPPLPPTSLPRKELPSLDPFTPTPFTVAMEQMQARASARGGGGDHGDHGDHGGQSPAAVAAASAEQWVRRERDARAAHADVTAGARSLHTAAAAAAERPSLSPMGRLSGGMSSWGAAAELQQVCACPFRLARVGASFRLG